MHTKSNEFPGTNRRITEHLYKHSLKLRLRIWVRFYVIEHFDKIWLEFGYALHLLTCLFCFYAQQLKLRKSGHVHHFTFGTQLVPFHTFSIYGPVTLIPAFSNALVAAF